MTRFASVTGSLHRVVRVLAVAALASTHPSGDACGETLREANDRLLSRLREVHALSDEQVDSLRAIFARSGMIGQGNPAVTRHLMTRAACEESLAVLDISYDDDSYRAICGHRYMSPLYDPAREEPGSASACIDQFEFPNIPCEFPVVWVRASEAARICEILGKRLCDAHEWEGACAGALLPPDYRFDLGGDRPDDALRAMRRAHNATWGSARTWSYGSAYRKGVCATCGQKSPGCDGGSWATCGSNTFPSGAFPDCRSALDAYDLHGNAAEHMNLPLDPSQLSSRGSRTYGYTEMKGSWFVFDAFYAHDDWCRWRAPFWHGSRVMDPTSHRNYHLGFRCCSSVDAAD